MSSLQPDVIVTRPPRIQTWYDRFQHIFASRIGELMPSATITFEIVFASVIGVPKIEKHSGHRIPFSIQNKSSKSDWSAAYAGFTKVIFCWRIRSEEGSGRFFRCRHEWFAGGRRWFEDQRLAILPRHRSGSLKKCYGSR